MTKNKRILNKSRNDKTPIILKMVRWIFPKLEVLAPTLANNLFVKVFFSPLKYVVPPKELEIVKRADKFNIYAANKKIQCYSWGKGPVVLLVHGWGGRSSQFRKFVDALVTAGFRVIGFDGPAHGNSQGRKTNIIEFEQTLLKLYEAVGEPHAIITHSFGGSAVLYAAMNGLKVNKLINIVSPTIGDEIINTYLKAIRGSWKTGNYFKSFMIKKYGKPFDEFTALHFIKHLPQKIDLLLIHDEDDEEVSIRHSHELIKIYPAAQLYVTKGLGHTRILKDDDVIRQCVTFVSKPSLS